MDGRTVREIDGWMYGGRVREIDGWRERERERERKRERERERVPYLRQTVEGTAGETRMLFSFLDLRRHRGESEWRVSRKTSRNLEKEEEEGIGEGARKRRERGGYEEEEG